MADDGRSGETGLMQFRGDRDAPDDLDHVFERRFTRAEEEEPEEFSYARRHASVFVPPADEEPATSKVTDVDGYRRLSIAVDDRMGLALPGQEARRAPPEQIVDEVTDGIGVGASRPQWVDAAYYPRPATGHRTPELLPRIGRRGAVRPLYVFPPEDRNAYTDASWPWGLVGKIFTSEGKTGSGALIGNRLVATAGHMVPWGSGPWWMRFVPAYHNGSSLHGAGVDSYVSDAKGYDTGVTGYDWAVLRLYEPLGSWLGYFGYNGFSNSWIGHPYWTVLGYPSAIAGGQRPSWEGSIKVFDTDGDSNGGLEIESKADMTPGNSGGPMFAWWNGDPRLVGVVSGQEEDWSPGFWPWEWGDTEKGNVVAGGAGFTNLMAWGRSNWP